MEPHGEAMGALATARSGRLLDNMSRATAMWTSAALRVGMPDVASLAGGPLRRVVHGEQCRASACPSKTCLAACRLRKGCKCPGRALCCMINERFQTRLKALAILLWNIAPQRCVCALAAQTRSRLYIKILARLALSHTLRCSCVNSVAGLTEASASD